MSQKDPSLRTWYKDIEILTARGENVRVLRRPIENDNTNARLDTEPFFFLPTLIEHTMADGTRNALKGMLSSLTVSDDKTWSIGVVSEHGTPTIIEIDTVAQCFLTVWRVHDELDALQVRLIGIRDALYIQTGGAKLLATARDVAGDPQARRILDLFNESITGSISLHIRPM